MPQRLNTPKVLVVDDQPDNLLAMKTVLETLDQELVTVSLDRDVLKALLHHNDFAVLIMDVQMPEMDGYAAGAIDYISMNRPGSGGGSIPCKD